MDMSTIDDSKIDKKTQVLGLLQEYDVSMPELLATWRTPPSERYYISRSTRELTRSILESLMGSLPDDVKHALTASKMECIPKSLRDEIAGRLEIACLEQDLRRLNLSESDIILEKYHALMDDGGHQKLKERIRRYVEGKFVNVVDIRILHDVQTVWVEVGVTSNEEEQLEECLPDELQGIVKFQTTSEREEKLQCGCDR